MIGLTKDLENFIFERPANRKEVSALRHRCENYQAGEPPAWNDDVFYPYSLYFGFLTALKVKRVLQELHERKAIAQDQNKAIRLIDFGAGTLGGSLGAFDFCREYPEYQIDEVLWLDQDPTAARWAEQRFEPWISKSREIKTLPESLSNTWIIASDVLNEMNPSSEATRAFWKAAFDRSDESTVFIFVDPAHKNANRALLEFRDWAANQMGILAPCTHALACPALKVKGEWCHEDRTFLAPGIFWNLTNAMGFERHRLQFSLLVLAKRASPFKADDHRIVSRPLRSKGKIEYWLCGEGKRFKMQVLKRHKKTHAEWLSAERGDVLPWTPPKTSSTIEGDDV